MKADYPGVWEDRALLYASMHAVFSGAPDPRLFQALTSSGYLGCLGRLRERAPGAAPLLDCLSLSALTSPEAELERARSDYGRVVLGLGRRASHPWESAYTSVSGLLMRPETLEVRNAYRACGYEPDLLGRVADDHLALECAFMAALAKRSAQLTPDDPGFGESLSAQASFVSGHLAKWVGSYAADVVADAPGSLYAHSAAALASFACWDTQLLREAVRSLRA